MTTTSGQLPGVSSSAQPPSRGGGDALDDRTRIAAGMTFPTGEPFGPIAYEYRAEPGFPGARGDRNIAKLAAEGWELTSRVAVSKKLEQVSFRRAKYPPPPIPPGMQYGPPPAPPWSPPQQVVQGKRRRGCIWWVGAIVVGLVVLGYVLIATGKNPLTPGGPPIVTGSSHTFEFRVTGKGSASMSWGTMSGQSSETSTLPWSKTKTVDGYDSASVVAQSTGAGGEVDCEILIDGVVKAHEKSTGDYAVVTCAAASDLG